MISSQHSIPVNLGSPQKILNVGVQPQPMSIYPGSNFAQRLPQKVYPLDVSFFQLGIREQNPFGFQEAAAQDYRHNSFSGQYGTVVPPPSGNPTEVSLPHSASYGTRYTAMHFQPVYYGFPEASRPPVSNPPVSVSSQRGSLVSIQSPGYPSIDGSTPPNYLGPELPPSIAIPSRHMSFSGFISAESGVMSASAPTHQSLSASYPGGSVMPQTFQSSLFPKLKGLGNDSKEQQLGKRTKVSRACDECRRKKTRCDIDSEHEMCSPCRRAGVSCTFARAQLKRGPAKKRASFSQSLNGNAHDISQFKESINRQRSTSVSSAVSDSALPSIESLLGYQKDALLRKSTSDHVQLPQISQSMGSHSSQSQRSNLPLLLEAVNGISETKSPKSPKSISDTTIYNNKMGESTKSVESKDASKIENLGDSISHSLTPPIQYDTVVHGVSHRELMEYYTFIHPMFPILPDLISDVDTMFCAAGPAKEYLVAALNNTSCLAVPRELDFATDNSTPFQSASIRDSHLTALLFIYLRTLDYSWLNASLDACDKLVSDLLSERSSQLAALVVALITIHSVVYETINEIPQRILAAAKNCERCQALLNMLQVLPETPTPAPQHFITAPEAALKTFGKLHRQQVTKSHATDVLRNLLPQLNRTPLETFVKKLIA